MIYASDQCEDSNNGNIEKIMMRVKIVKKMMTEEVIFISSQLFYMTIPAHVACSHHSWDMLGMH